MKNLLFISALLLSLSVTGQFGRIVPNNSSYDCLSDSSRESFLSVIKSQNVDSIIVINSASNAGVTEMVQHIIIWIDNGRAKIKKYRGCDNVIDTTYSINLRPVLAFINKTTFKRASETLKSSIAVSHSMGYNTTIALGKKRFEMDVRSHHLQRTNYPAQSDARVRLTSMLLKL